MSCLGGDSKRQVLSVVVITSALHAEGRGFKPRSAYLFLSLILYTPPILPITHSMTSSF